MGRGLMGLRTASRHIASHQWIRIGGRSLATMRAVRPDRIRNIGIIAHIDAGKTTTTERMLFYAGNMRHMGDVDDGSTVTDFLRDERERGITIQSAAVSFQWGEHHLNLIDTPGHVDFTLEVERSLRVMDGAVAIIEAVAGVQAQTETVWRQANKNRLPRVIFVNKLDREGASLENTIASIRDRLDVRPLVLQLPLFDRDSKFIGALDLVSQQVIEYLPTDHLGQQPRRYAIKEHQDIRVQEAAQKATTVLHEDIADLDDGFFEKMLNGEILDETALKRVIRKYTLQRKVFPIICGASLRNKGVQGLLDAIIIARKKDGSTVHVEPTSAGKAAALAFKVTHTKQKGPLVFFRVYSGSIPARHGLFNVTQHHKEFPQKLLKVHADSVEEVNEAPFGGIFCATGLSHAKTGDTLTIASQQYHVVFDSISVPEPVFFAAIEGDTKQDEDMLITTLEMMVREDPSLSVRVNKETGQTLLGGMGELHLEIVESRLKREHKISVRLGKPRVAYREMLLDEIATSFQYDNTFGGDRLIAKLAARLIPNRSNKNGNDIILSENLSELNEEQRLAVKNGVESALEGGPLIGLPLIGTKVMISGVSGDELAVAEYRPTALQACAAGTVRQGMRSVGGLLVEPVMSVEVIVPERFVPEVIKELTRRRGGIESVDISGSSSHRIGTITSAIPLQGMVGYATTLRSGTQGSGSFSMHFREYESPSESHKETILKEIRGY